MSKAKYIEKEDEELKKYVKELGEIIETKDVDRFLEFVKEHQDLYEPGVYRKYIFARKLYGDDFVTLTLFKMAMMRTDISEETKRWYKDWYFSWRNGTIAQEGVGKTPNAA